MFRSLGLFASASCPDPSCHRSKCLFNHGESSTAQKAKKTPSKSVAKATKPAGAPVEPGKPVIAAPASSAGSKSKPEESTAASGDRSAAKRQRLDKDEEMGKGTPAALVDSSSLKPGPSPSKLRPEPLLVRKPSVPEVIINPLRPPSIPTNNLKLSPQPWADRQKGLQTLFQQFTKLYRPILDSSPDLAHTSALREESDVSAKCPNVKSYKSAIHHSAVSVSRRPAPDSATHPSVGTVKESRAAYEKLEKDLASRLTKEKMAPYLLSLNQFELWSYPDPRNAVLMEGGDEPDCEGTDQTCSRCKKPFVVSSKDLEKRVGECVFHHGKIQPERIEGRRKWIYTCCRRERGEAGCEEGVHVFTDGDDDAKLAKRKAFKSVKQVWAEKQSTKDKTKPGSANGANGAVIGRAEGQASKVCEVVAMDCEMIYTTGGSSLARVTIVDQAGDMLLDERVRQPVPILDINTRFSGLHPGDLDDAVMDLDAVRSAACVFIGPDTVLVGHGLENDLRALRLLHDRIIDTAIIFPHDKGAPYRRALRDLVKEKLGYFIQERTADLGHSSAEDAKATLEVLKWKVRDDAS